MDRDEQQSVDHASHTSEDIMMRNQVLNLRIHELEKRVRELEADDAVAERHLFHLRAKASDLADRLKEVEAERKKLGRRVASAHIVLYDYDGFYNPDTKQGNIEQLASLIDDAISILSGAEDGLYGGEDDASRT